jgi:pyrroloquinoline-quinone synthase
MITTEFLEQLEAAIARYDLLCHPFYRAWAAGELTRDDLREYARNYYHHVEAFPTYLAELAVRLDEGELRRAVLANMCDENGTASGSGPASEAHSGPHSEPHSELWLDFAEGMGAQRDMRGHKPLPEVDSLIAHFHRVAGEGAPEEALAAFYAYESQVPRVAREKARGLREMYGADDKTCGYFTLHAIADVYHSNVWREQIANRLQANPEAAHAALDAAEMTAKMLWQALDGIEAARTTLAA